MAGRDQQDSPALAPGSKFAGSLIAGGQRLAEALVTLKDQLAADKQDEPGSLALTLCRGKNSRTWRPSAAVRAYATGARATEIQRRAKLLTTSAALTFAAGD